MLLLPSLFIMISLLSRGAFGFGCKPLPSKLTTHLSMVSMDLTASAASFSTDASSSASSSSQVLDPLVVCGPSGVGKGTIIDKFMKELGGHHHFGFTVSHTTRSPRPGEVDGMHYHFTTHEEMEEAIGQQNAFLEHAHVHGNMYGTSWQSLRDVQQNGKRCLLDIDVQGVQALKQQGLSMRNQANWKPRYVFIAPPSLPILLDRLSSRGTEDEASLQRRTANAQAEVEYGLKKGNFDAIVVNDDLDEACREFTRVVKELYSIE
jgi:guanylate kinase